MKQWEVARYLIDAKKDVDSIIYISENLNKIPLILRAEYVSRVRDHFYINCCVVLDEYLDRNNIKNNNKTKWKQEHEIIKDIYYERDKNSAHIDKDYRIKKYNTINELKLEMIRQIKEVMKTIKSILPKKLELNFVPHDKVLFRLINGLNYEKEEKIRQNMHTDYGSLYSQNNYFKQVEIIYDIKEFRGLSEDEKRNKGVTVEIGLNYYETIQNLEDFFIIVNYQHKLNYWTDYVKSKIPKYLELKNSGVIDQYDRPKNIRCFSEEFRLWAFNMAMDVYGNNIFDRRRQ